MFDPHEEWRRWLAQAQSDLAFAEHGFAAGYFSQVCFICQQAGEKALKAVLYGRGERRVTGHAITLLLRRAGEPQPGELREAGAVLDTHYISARYPNGLPGGAPCEMHTAGPARAALVAAHALVAFAAAAAGPAAT